MVTPSLLPGDRRRDGAAGHRSRRDLARDRDLRRRAVDRRDAARDRAALRHGRRRHLRPLGGDRPRASPRNASGRRTACTSGKTTSTPRSSTPSTGERLPDGEEGELVFTSLTKEAMPVVRYRTGDLTRLAPGTAHPAFRRMEKVTGRTDDMMIVRGVNVFPTQIEEQILRIDGLDAALRLRPHPAGPHGRADGAGRGAGGRAVGGGAAAARRPARVAREEPRRRHDHGRGDRSRGRSNARSAKRSGSTTGAVPDGPAENGHTSSRCAWAAVPPSSRSTKQRRMHAATARAARTCGSSSSRLAARATRRCSPPARSCAPLRAAARRTRAE